MFHLFHLKSLTTYGFSSIVYITYPCKETKWTNIEWLSQAWKDLISDVLGGRNEQTLVAQHLNSDSNSTTFSALSLDSNNINFIIINENCFNKVR